MLFTDSWSLWREGSGNRHAAATTKVEIRRGPFAVSPRDGACSFLEVANEGGSLGRGILLLPLKTLSHAFVPHTFHTIASDKAAPLPFENPPHLQLTGRFSGSNIPEYEILFKQLFSGGDLATRECLLRLRTIASEQVRSNLGVALKHDDYGDPITVVTRRTTPSSSMWVTTGDVKIRFPSAEVARAVNTQQR